MNKTDYYRGCAVPKPGSSRKKPLTNGYKDKPQRICFFCGTPYAERHEVFPGPNRQISIEQGFQVDLCHQCHEEIQQRSTKQGIEKDMALRKKFQREYEEKITSKGFSQEQARSLWIALIGRSYL